MKNKGLIITLLVVGVAVYLWRHKRNADTGEKEKSTGLFGIGSVIPSLFKAPTADSSTTTSDSSNTTADSSTSTSDSTTSDSVTVVLKPVTSDGATQLAVAPFSIVTKSRSPFACMRDSQK